ncbi:MAG: DUF167 domain-containing protein [Candidatus Paceibacterota bacterium]
MYIKVRVKAGAKRDEIEKVNENTFNVAVKADARQNMANKSVVRLVAKYLEIEENKVRIINGHQSPSKLISILD